jgi:hypothetical protein
VRRGTAEKILRKRAAFTAETHRQAGEIPRPA